MQTYITESHATLWASKNDTRDWASRVNNSWPGSALSGNRFRADFDSYGLVDFTLNGKHISSREIPEDELSACCADLLKGKLPENHPAYSVIVGQFKKRIREREG